MTAATCGVRPIVSLKSNVQLEKQPDGSYKIVESGNATWSTSHTETITIMDEGTGLAAGATIQYGWSESKTSEPITWKTVTLANYTEGDLSASIEITESTLTGKYYLWVKPVIVKDIAENAQTSNTTSENQYWFDNTAPKIIIGDGITAETLTAETLTAENYGGYVTNYEPTNGVNSTGTQWRIFHSDGENIYLIADTYVPVENYVPTGYSSTSGDYGFNLYGYENYNGTADIASNIANKWLKKYTTAGYTATSTNKNAKATAYLLDTTMWKGFKDSNGYAEYSIGSPTLELFRDSYNITHATDIETGVNAKGYQLRWKTENNSNSYKNYISGLSTSESLYVISSSANAFGMWLASPSGSNECFVMRVYANGLVDNYNYSYDDLRCPPASFSKV